MESINVLAEDGTTLHVRVSRGQPKSPFCVLVHGSGDGAYVWRDICEDLQNQFSVVAVDLRGHGDSGASRSGRYDVWTHARDVARIASALGLQQFYIVGHSLGGQIAVLLASSVLRANILGAILIDVCPDMNVVVAKQASENLRDSFRTYQSREEFAQHLRDSRPFLSERMAAMLARDALREVTEGFRLKLDAGFVEYERKEIDRIALAVWRKLFAEIVCPAALFRGVASAMVSAMAAAEAVRLLRNGSLVTIPYAGHAVMSDNPESFRVCAIRFLNKLKLERPIGVWQQ